MNSIQLGKWAAGNMSILLKALFGNRQHIIVGILAYHRTSPHILGLPPPSINVTPDSFARQISGLLRQGFNFLSLKELLQASASGRKLSSKNIVVTFDV